MRTLNNTYVVVAQCIQYFWCYIQLPATTTIATDHFVSAIPDSIISTVGGYVATLHITFTNNNRNNKQQQAAAESGGNEYEIF